MSLRDTYMIAARTAVQSSVGSKTERLYARSLSCKWHEGGIAITIKKKYGDENVCLSRKGPKVSTRGENVKNGVIVNV
jgi:hypothetical protein